MANTTHGFRYFLHLAAGMWISGTTFYGLLVIVGIVPKHTDLPLLIEAPAAGLVTIVFGTVLSFVLPAAYIRYLNWRYSHWSDIDREHIDRGES